MEAIFLEKNSGNHHLNENYSIVDYLITILGSVKHMETIRAMRSDGCAAILVRNVRNVNFKFEYAKRVIQIYIQCMSEISEERICKKHS